MAIVFELVVNYGQDHAAVENAGRIVAAHPPLTAGPHLIRLHEPLVTTVHDAAGLPYLEMSVIPAQVGCKVALDGNRPQLRLTSEELSELGAGLYTLLATLTGYRAARAGWDPEVFVDPVELRREWAEELAAGALPGLVVAEDVRLGVPMNAFVRFTDGFLWIPYESGRPSFGPSV
ncbi:hypothetical protein [Actinomadura formosensis]|uniref:hypothetical protein n=1 Tax=Actinomadura formosensis TaxID=60706 RepID=UPI003D90CE8D